MEVIAEINEVELALEVDTGATLSLISKDTYKRLWHKAIAPTLKPSVARLKAHRLQEKILNLP